MPERFALIIANSQFNDPKLARLVAPNKDAETLKRVLEDPKIGGFHVTLLIDKPYAEIRREIARLFEGKVRSDSLLLYYSGHGIKDDAGDLYLATQETQTDLISAASIEADFVKARLEKSNSQRKVIILDCCHSGAIMRGAKAPIGSSVDTQAAFGGSGYGWGILTASNAIEYAWEDSALPVEARTSVLTRFLVEGLESGAADLNHDGEVSLQELYDYVHEKVRTGEGAKQTPLMWQKAEGQIIIAQNPHLVVEVAVVLSQELQQAIGNPLAGVRAGAVIELEKLLHNPNTRLVHLARAALAQLTNDDSRSVSQAAAAVLGLSVSPPAMTPERHPSLSGDLRPFPATIEVGQETTWTFALHNDGDTDLSAINARHGSTLLVKPFDLKVGATKPLTFTASYPTSGRKTEEVVAATTSGGITVEHTATARVTVRQPKPALHPGLKLALSADPQVADTGVEVRWTILLRNSGDDNLQKVVVYFDNQPKCEPFDLLVGREKRFTLGRTYNSAGDKSERVTAAGIASDGSSVRDEVQTNITVRQPAKQPQASPQEALREPLKAFAKAHDEEQTIQCPICNAELKARNLIRHFDKVHAEDTSIDTASMRKKIEAATSKAITGSESAGEFLGQFFGSEAPARQRTAQSTAPVDKSSRAYFKMLMDSQRPDTQLQCPICNATLQAKNLLWHFDRRHAENAPEPTQKPVSTSAPPKASIPAAQECNITKPIVLKLMCVPAGEFLMGSDPSKDKTAQSSEQPQHRVNLPEYYISAYPITNTQYEVFVKATGYAAPEHWKRTLLKPKIPSGVENQAITYVSWHDAVAFCQWLSKETGKTFRLPTEAEWEKAARGIDGRVAFQQPQQALAITRLIAYKPQSDSPYGCVNMMDGIIEWTRSLYWTYPYNANDGRENLRATGARVVRGSKALTSFNSFTSNKAPRYAERQGYEPSAKVFPLGFRVVMVPTPEHK